MPRTILAVCIAAVMCSGCGPTLQQQSDAHWLEYKQTVAKSEAEYVAARAKMQVKWDYCIRFLKAQQMGSSALELEQISQLCIPDKINSTRVGATELDQWVYDFVEDGTIYLYYTNGRLTGIQY